MKQMRRRLTSLLLVLAIICSFTVTVSASYDIWWEQYVTSPMEDLTIAGVKDGKVESTGNYVLFTSDVHRYAYLTKDLLAAANGIIAADGGSGNVGLIAFGGDLANEQAIYADNMSILKAAVATSEGTVAAYTKGNHESDVKDEDFIKITGMSRIGETVINKESNYYFFNFGAAGKGQEFLETDIAALKEYLEKLPEDNEKPVFIVSHFPLHYYNDRRNSKLADQVVDLLNKHPETVFLWGHNHTEQDPGYGMIRLPGDIIQTGVKAETGKEIKFTYACLGALRDGVNGANGLLAKVDGAKVTFRYIDLNNTGSDEVWKDAQGNENAIRIPGTPEISSTTNVDMSADQKVIKLANLQIDRPLVDKAPDASAAEYSDKFSAGEVSWGGVTKYDFGTEYTAKLTLTAEEGYSFASDAVVSINKEFAGPMPGQKNNVATTVVAEGGKTAEVTYTFPATAAKGTPVEAVTKLENGGQYVLASADNYAASYEFDPTQHGEESKPDYTVEGADVVVQGGKLVSATDKWMTFTAQKDAHGYLLFSDESFLGYGQTYDDAEVINYMDISTRGGEMGIQANNMSAEAIYSNWNVDEKGNVFVSIDGINHYPVSKDGKFSLSTKAEDTNVKLYKVGTENSGAIYTAAVNLPTPAAGAAPATTVADEYYGYTATKITWSPEAAAFEYGKAYTATVVLTAKEGFTFTQPLTGRVSGHVASKIEVAADGKTATVTYTYAPTDAKPGAAATVQVAQVDSLKAGGKYIIVGAGYALTYNYVDGIYMKATPITIADGKITSEVTEDMILTAAEGTDGVALTYGGKYMDAKSIDNSPDTWGFTDATDAKSAIGFAYKDGLLTVASTGAAAAGPGAPPPPPPPPGGAVSALYFSNGHFNYGTIASTPVTIYKVVDTFKDVAADEWYSAAVNWAVANEITNGVGGGNFAPAKELTRVEIITMIWRSQGKPAPTSTENPFKDVKTDDWYDVNAILWANEKGIATGTGNGFEPLKTCTRAEIVTMLYRVAGKPEVTEEIAFTDVAADAWYADAVAWAVKEGVTTGTSSTTFEPGTICTRSQAVTFLFRMK